MGHNPADRDAAAQCHSRGPADCGGRLERYGRGDAPGRNWSVDAGDATDGRGAEQYRQRLAGRYRAIGQFGPIAVGGD
ncbi:hypothetical protein D3C76_1215070 [compost metagenome]